MVDNTVVPAIDGNVVVIEDAPVVPEVGKTDAVSLVIEVELAAVGCVVAGGNSLCVDCVGKVIWPLTVGSVGREVPPWRTQEAMSHIKIAKIATKTMQHRMPFLRLRLIFGLLSNCMCVFYAHSMRTTSHPEGVQ